MNGFIRTFRLPEKGQLTTRIRPWYEFFMNNRSSSFFLLAACCVLLQVQGAGKTISTNYLVKKVDSASNTLHPWRLVAVGGSTLTAFVIGHGFLNDLWWKGEAVPFHTNWQQDARFAIGADKLGHQLMAFATTRTYDAAFRWCGLDSTSAVLAGAGVSIAYQTYIELRDGFSRDYGFSWGDVIANTTGAALPVVQRFIPALRPIDLQISFSPSAAFNRGEYGAIIDDYTSTTHWVSIGVYDYMPASWQEWYPPWLNLAVGHSVANIDGRGGGQHVLYLSLDWNLSRIKGLPPWLREALQLLHMYHLPAPAMRVTQGVAFFGLKF